MMCSIQCSVFDTDQYIYSRSLSRALKTLTNNAFVRFDAHHTNVCVQVQPSASATPHASPLGKVRSTSKLGKMTSFVEVDLQSVEGDWTRGFATGPGWKMFCTLYEDGTKDLIALRLEGGAHDAHCRNVLAAIWDMLREDCLRELTEGAGEAVTSALLWAISNKTGSAVLVLDANGRILQANAAGRDVLESANVVRDTGGVLRCAVDGQNKSLYHALRECASETVDTNEEFILFLESVNSTGRLPLSLSQHRCATHSAPLIVAILPCQPDIKRIEMLAQMMGLSPAESRVAALMQLGLPNRKAASIAGVKEQTFNTYAKRVLSKLDMGCRAEMAHNLTWQASVGRAS